MSGGVRLFVLTGTFFCDNTTAQFFPLTPTEVIFAAVMALNAYSDDENRVELATISRSMSDGFSPTDLIEAPLIREDRDMSIISGATCRFGLLPVNHHYHHHPLFGLYEVFLPDMMMYES